MKRACRDIVFLLAGIGQVGCTSARDAAVVEESSVTDEDSGRDIANEIAELVAYQRKAVEKEKLTVPMYLAFTKPYAIWDTRALKQPTVNLRGKKVASKELPNYCWGAVGVSMFKLGASDLKSYPERFLEASMASVEAHRSHARDRLTGLMELVKAVKRSPHSIFVQQAVLGRSAYHRVDEVFREDEAYWRYELVDGTHLPMSPRRRDVERSFSKGDELILLELEKLELYGAVKVGAAVVLLTGGMLDNSQGYIWTERDVVRPHSLGHLFHIRFTEQVAPNLYFYVAS